MQFVTHPSNTRTISAPSGKGGKVAISELPITDTSLGDRHAIVSFWKPTEAELAQLAAGHVVSLWVLGVAMPPVALTVSPP